MVTYNQYFLLFMMGFVSSNIAKIDNLLLETDYNFLLEDGSSLILLE